MKTNVNFGKFRRWFEQNRPNNFSRAGLLSLFDYLEQYEEDCGTEIEFDPIALCCDYTEYENIEEFWQDYDKEDYPDTDAIMDFTVVIDCGQESFIMEAF